MINGHANISAVNFSNSTTNSFIEGAAMFVNYVFDCWPFLKLYMEIPGYNLDQVASRLSDIFVAEEVFREHVFKYGQRWDLHVLAIYRDQWNNFYSSLYGVAE